MKETTRPRSSALISVEDSMIANRPTAATTVSPTTMNDSRPAVITPVAAGTATTTTTPTAIRP